MQNENIDARDSALLILGHSALYRDILHAAETFASSSTCSYENTYPFWAIIDMYNVRYNEMRCIILFNYDNLDDDIWHSLKEYGTTYISLRILQVIVQKQDVHYAE